MEKERAENKIDSGSMRVIVTDEERVLARVLRLLDVRQARRVGRTDYDKELVALRDEIGEARLEDVPALIAQMERLQAVAARRAEVPRGHVDLRSPYFGRIVLQEGEKKREVLIGRSTYLDPLLGITIVDWRDAPVSRVYYRYEEGDDYDELFGNKAVSGEVLIRRSLVIADNLLLRIGCPQGTFLHGRDGQWRQVDRSLTELHGGQGMAVRPEQYHGPGSFGVGRDGDGREDKHLQEIAALIDPRQFDLITRPESGLVVIQGGAGSGKTTIGLHRIAYLAYQLPERFNPKSMLVMAFNDALVLYMSRVLPALGVEGTPVTTFQKWALRRRMQALPGFKAPCADEAPSEAVRLKKHPAMLQIIDDLVAEIEQRFTDRLREVLADQPESGVAVKAWENSKGRPLAQRYQSLWSWLTGPSGAGSPIAVRHAVEREILRARGGAEDVLSVWGELLTDRARLRSGLERYAPGDVTDTELAIALDWCSMRCAMILNEAEENDDERLEGEARNPAELLDSEVGIDGQQEHQPVALDWEDNALLLRIGQRLRGPLRRGKESLKYQHVFVDEAQDLSPVELAVVLDTVNSGSMTLAGDIAQRLMVDNGFSDWKTVLQQLGLAHVEIEPLKISYRSTFEIIAFANHVLGPLEGRQAESATRRGAPVELYRFMHAGDAVGFLAEALRGLAQREPLASTALIARYPEQADLYYDGLTKADVPNLRRIAAQDFPFKPGVDVTDVRQVKGLEFDYVVLLDVSSDSYGTDQESRHLLHIAATRAAHQLWLMVIGTPSRLLPEELRDRGF
jgi:DNA helicase II / ATP-dependent DNA helicase PcrA